MKTEPDEEVLKYTGIYFSLVFLICIGAMAVYLPDDDKSTSAADYHKEFKNSAFYGPVTINGSLTGSNAIYGPITVQSSQIQQATIDEINKKIEANLEAIRELQSQKKQVTINIR